MANATSKKPGDWAAVQRKLIKSDLWLSEPFTRGQAWVDLILLAAYEPGFIRIRGVKVEYQRGQYATAERFLCERWTWSRGKLRRFLDELETEQQIVQQKNNASTVLTIVNYNHYQGDGTANGTTDRTADGPQTGQQTVQQTDQIKEVKKEKKERREKKGDTPLPPVFVLPPSIRTDSMNAAVAEWLTYKAERRETYKPTGLKNFLGQISNAVAMHGEAMIIAKLQKAMASGWKGWDFADSAPRGSPSVADDPRNNKATLAMVLERLSDERQAENCDSGNGAG